METVDVAIIGCGPAGMSAALNVRIRKKSLMFFGSGSCGHKVEKSPQIDNYLGFPGVKGSELLRKFMDHLEHLGIAIEEKKLQSIHQDGDGFVLMTADEGFRARSVIIATGVSAAGQIAGEAEHLGQGVGYCATCDGPLYKGKEVGVVGYGAEAGEEVRYLSDVAAKVVYWPQGQGEAGGFPPTVEIRRERAKAIRRENNRIVLATDKGEAAVDGLFILRESLSADQLMAGLAMEEGAIAVNRELGTSIPGVFAAGDCTGKPYQLAKAVGEGAVAALSAVKYLDRAK